MSTTTNETNVNSAADPTEERPAITVKMSTLVSGLAILFQGVIQMLQALDPQTAAYVASQGIKDGSAGEGFTEPVERMTEETKAAETPAAVNAPAQEESSQEPTEKQQVAKEDTAPATPGVTLDDITKIIVGKIKQNPENNEKIRALVVSHGAARVSELPPSKYEAFLTDISQL